jgi:GTPase SAR1 family protein
MGETNMKSEDARGENLSTVGVDIGDLVLQRGGREVVFSTWDFGGQREYYATHQYFLSKRSLYLVVWKVTDGEKGLHGLQQWLVNIQARAPNAPVIIVGTHLDQVKKMQLPPSHIADMHQLIIDRSVLIHQNHAYS